MNRSAVRIRPPAPQKPAQLSGFPCSLRADSNLSLTLSVACSTLLADQIRRFRYSVAQALLTNPPTSSTETRSIERVSLFSAGGFQPFADASLPHAKKQRFFPRGPRRRLLDFETTGDGVKQGYPLAGFGRGFVVLRHAISGCSSCSRTLRICFSSEGYLDIPLLPFGLSSPVSERVQSSHHAGLTLHLYKSF